jgi:hypothetical protein
MLAHIIPVQTGKELPANKPPNSRIPWPFALACCLYYLFVYRGLATAIPVFVKLFDGLGVVLPLPTRLLMATYSWLFPVLFLGAVILTIAKQIVILETIRLRIANLFLILVGVVFVPLVLLVMYSPLFVLMWKLHSIK